MAKNYDVRGLGLAELGQGKIEWAEGQMPVLRAIRARFEKEKPLKGARIAACLHVTSETGNLVRTLKAGGAEVYLCASNPLSTQDEVAAACTATYDVPTWAIKGEDKDTYYSHIKAVIAQKPNLTLDDGADLVSVLHSEHKDLLPGVYAGMEETTTGVIRLRAMAQEGALKYPVIAVNDAATKHLFDNRYGTGQSTCDGIIRATNILFAGLNVVAAGYGWCGRGFASRARGLGAHVIVTEVDPIRALEAVLDGFTVLPMDEAAKIGDIFCTLTGDISVLAPQHFKLMKDGAVLCNSGHFNVEIDLPGLKAMAKEVKNEVRPLINRYTLPNGHNLYVLADGRLVNLSCADGHPASVMDMSFATQALCAEYAVQNKGKLAAKVHDVPRTVENWIATLKLKTMGITIDELTAEQKKYLASWNEGT